MPAISEVIAFASSLPLWAWAAIGVGAVGLYGIDDRADRAKSLGNKWFGLDRGTQLAIAGAVAGFAAGFRYPPETVLGGIL